MQSITNNNLWILKICNCWTLSDNVIKWCKPRWLFGDYMSWNESIKRTSTIYYTTTCAHLKFITPVDVYPMDSIRSSWLVLYLVIICFGCSPLQALLTLLGGAESVVACHSLTVPTWQRILSQTLLFDWHYSTYDHYQPADTIQLSICYSKLEAIGSHSPWPPTPSALTVYTVQYVQRQYTVQYTTPVYSNVQYTLHQVKTTERRKVDHLCGAASSEATLRTENIPM